MQFEHKVLYNFLINCMQFNTSAEQISSMFVFAMQIVHIKLCPVRHVHSGSGIKWDQIYSPGIKFNLDMMLFQLHLNVPVIFIVIICYTHS